MYDAKALEIIYGNESSKYRLNIQAVIKILKNSCK